MQDFQLCTGNAPFPVVDGLQDRYHSDAVDRAGWQAKLTTGAFIGNDGVHLPRGPENCVDRAGLNTQGTANAGLLVD